MLFTEFNMEDALEVRGEEKYIEGLEQGVRALIDTCIEFGISRQDTQARIQQRFSMDEATSAVYLDKYWNMN